MSDDANLPHFKRTRERNREQRFSNLEENTENLDQRLATLEAAKGARGSGKAFMDLTDRVAAVEAKQDDLEARVAALETAGSDPGT